MQIGNTPAKFQTPFASGAGSQYIRQIPATSQVSVQAGAASLIDGFPPLTFVAIAAGGVPPFGQDFNGLLNQITKWDQWQAAGGPVSYDSTFSAAVGGYPRGARLLSSTGHAVYQSLIDNNSANPETAFSNWRIVSSVWSGTSWTAGGSANVQTLSLLPAPTSLAQLTGIPLTIVSVGTNSGTSAGVTLTVNNLAATAVVAPGGIPLGEGALVSTYPYQVVYNGSAFVMTSRSSSFYDPNTVGVRITGTGSGGANLLLAGNGTVTPKKYVRASGGHLAVVNDAYTAEILTLSDTGDITNNGGITSVGDITSSGGHVRAGVGATDSGDPYACATLGDFPRSVSGTDSYTWFKQPNGMIIQSGTTTTVTGHDPITFPNAFPNACAQVLAHESSPNGWLAVSPTIFGTEQFSRFAFALYCVKWDGSAWGYSGGVGTRYIAIGY